MKDSKELTYQAKNILAFIRYQLIKHALHFKSLKEGFNIIRLKLPIPEFLILQDYRDQIGITSFISEFSSILLDTGKFSYNKIGQFVVSNAFDK